MTQMPQMSYCAHIRCRLLNGFYGFSDKLYGLIICCSPEGTTDHIITQRIQPVIWPLFQKPLAI